MVRLSLAMMFYEEKKFNLEDPIDKWLSGDAKEYRLFTPGFIRASAKIIIFVS
jgi:CubicO group peptidase (beta-lactamase class C family)